MDAKDLSDPAVIRIDLATLPSDYVILTLNHGGETAIPESMARDLLTTTLPRTGITFEQTGPRQYREVDPARREPLNNPLT